MHYSHYLYDFLMGHKRLFFLKNILDVFSIKIMDLEQCGGDGKMEAAFLGY